MNVTRTIASNGVLQTFGRGIQTAVYNGPKASKLRGAFRNARHIELKGIPTSATPSDIRRAVVRANAEGVLDVALIYSHFRPTGRALLTLTHSHLLESNLQTLDKAMVAGVPVTAFPVLVEPTPVPRQRGAKGRAEAAERGAITGDGPHAGVSNRERSVTMWGLPGRLTADQLAAQLRQYELEVSPQGRHHIFKIMPPEGQFTMVSRFLVTLASVTEAHRLVRELHLTHWRPELHGSKYAIRARIIY